MNRKIMIMAVSVLLVVGAIFSQEPKERPSSWELLKEFVLIPGVSEHEERVADFVRAHLPANVEAETDDMHNLWFTVGKGFPHIVFVAHMDELGFIVEEITHQGTLKVSRKGGFLPQSYEGHSVAIYTEKGTVEGVVIPRPGYFQRSLDTASFETENVEIYLGVSDQSEAETLGVSEGNMVTIRKKIVEFSEDLLATRAVDDRAGCAALLEAAHRVDWSRIEGRAITFAWDVQEETGLFGASRLAKKLNADFVFPVDTFVSSAAPFDSKRFAYLPLGKGAVLRAIDSSSITPCGQVKKVLAIAEAEKIPVQMGNTRGGNDGSAFVPHGAVNIPLSWPGIYSHSFIEKIHRADLEALTDLIVALVRDWK